MTAEAPALLPSAETCECPKCGRLHKDLKAGEPPAAIAGPSLLRSVEMLKAVPLIAPPPDDAQVERVARAIARSYFCNSFYRAVDGTMTTDGPALAMLDRKINEGWSAFREHAGAAIAAMHRPDDAKVKRLREALERVRDEIQQANGGKGPTLPLSVHILELICAALADDK